MARPRHVTSETPGTAIAAHVLRDTGFAAATVLVEGEPHHRGGGSSTGRSRRVAARVRRSVSTPRDCWLIPGLIDAHAHGYATLLRGTENSLPLELWSLDTALYGRAYDAAAMRAAILLGAAERIQRRHHHGWIDHSPMVHLAEAALGRARGVPGCASAGRRSCTTSPTTRCSGLAVAAGGRSGSPAARRRSTPPPTRGASASWCRRRSPAGCRCCLGPNAPQRCSPAAWALWRDLRDRHGVGVHTHLMETRAQQAVGARWPGGLVAEMERQACWMIDCPSHTGSGSRSRNAKCWRATVAC